MYFIVLWWWWILPVLGTVLDMVGEEQLRIMWLDMWQVERSQFYLWTYQVFDDGFHWHVHLNAIVNPVCVILYSIV